MMHSIRLFPHNSFIIQEVLRKFQFFPIKCKIQLAAEMFADIREDLLVPGAMNCTDARECQKLPRIKSKVNFSSGNSVYRK